MGGWEMKKWLVLLMIIGLMAASLSGCAQKAPVEQQQAPGQLTIKVTNMPSKAYVQGSANRALANLEIKPAANFAAGSTIEATLTSAIWNQPLPGSAANPGWANVEIYNFNRSIRFTQTGTAGLDMVTLVFPTVNIDPAAAAGNLMVTLGGTAGVTGDYTLAAIAVAATLTADKPIVNVNALDQPAGNIIITEVVKDGFSSAAADGYLRLSLPSGINFSSNPKVLIDGKEVQSIKVDEGGQGKNYIQWQGKNMTSSFKDSIAEKIEITAIFYNIDPRFTTKDIIVGVSGQVLTGAGGSTDTIASVANATAQRLNKGSASFVIGSKTFMLNGVSQTMDVAPYMSNNQVFLPLRYAANALAINDNNISWDQTKQSVTLVKGDKVVQVAIGSASMLINGVPVTMDVTPQLVEQRVMLPISWIAPALGATVVWDAPTQTTTLSY